MLNPRGMAPKFKELEDAVCNVIQIIKQIPELERLKIAVVGGLALWHYLADHRGTDNINFITSVSTPPSLIKRKLLGHPKSPFREEQQKLFYRSPAGWDIRIEFSSQWLFPYLPRAARLVRELLYGEVPYISLADLIVFKLDASWLAPAEEPRKWQDGEDAAALLENEIAQRATNPEKAENTRTLICPATVNVVEPVVRLSPRQENFVRDAFCDVAQYGSRDKSWWEDCLGLSLPSAPGRPHANSEPNRPLGLYGMQSRATEEPNSSWDDWDGYERLDGRANLQYRRRVNSMPQGPSWNSPWSGSSMSEGTITPGQATPGRCTPRPSFCTVIWPTAPPANHYFSDVNVRNSISLSPHSTLPREDYFGPHAGLVALPMEEELFSPNTDPAAVAREELFGPHAGFVAVSREEYFGPYVGHAPVSRDREEYFGPHAGLVQFPREDYFGPHAGLVSPNIGMDMRPRTRVSRSDSGYSSAGDSVCYVRHPGGRYCSSGESTPDAKAHFSSKSRDPFLRTVVEVTSTDEQDGDVSDEMAYEYEESPAITARRSVAFMV